MVNSYVIIGKAAARHIVRGESLNPKVFYPLIAPNASSFENNELKSPQVITNNNAAYESYRSGWSVQSMAGVRLWIQIIANIRDKGQLQLFLISSWDMFFGIMKQAFPYVSIAELDLPCAYPSGNTTVLRMMNLTEYLREHPNISTPFSFFCQLLEIALFGFALDRNTLLALRFTEQELSSYILHRLSGGRYLHLLTSHSSKRKR